MDTTTLTFDLLKIILPSALVFLAGFLAIRTYLQNEQKKRLYELQMANKSAITPLRLQAAERLMMFIERSHPNNLSPRLYQSGMMARDMQMAMASNIREEFEHNISQQIYITSDTWLAIRACKDMTIQAINKALATSSTEATGIDLSRRVLELMEEWDSDYFEYASIKIKDEVKGLF